MEQQINPYEAGQATQQGHSDPSAEMPVTAVALSSLISTKFWVSLVGITMLITIAINLIGMVFMGSQMPSGAPAGFFVAWIIPLVMIVIQVILALRLVQYGKAIGRLEGSANNQDLERAMEVHTKFWRLAGIVVIVMFGLMLLGMIIGFSTIA
ncbi:MAG: DUF5362 family protein [Akkermansiaceae bacterium]